MPSTPLLRRATALLLVALALTGVAAMAFGRAAPMSPSVMALRATLPQTMNYTDPSGPLLSGRFAPAPLPTSVPPAPDELVVVTYNLRYGEAISETVTAFQTVEPLPAADIILLQEMDEAGVVSLARALGYDYIYAPASVAEDGDDFGNAILSRWPLSDPRKLILPGLHPLTGQQRTATRATARVGGADVLLYSVHLEVATAPPELRRRQVAAVLEDVPDDAAAVIIGGDFNTIMARGVVGLAEQAAVGDLQLLTDGLGPTLTRFGRPLARADHIVTRGFERLDGGVLSEVTASDHFPVWARLASKG